ncbi:MAG: serine/threonine protein kinase [Polyangiaceae bacterium]|nr:serine/threonine protein kinase [Polyangiaceae bacterium]
MAPPSLADAPFARGSLLLGKYRVRGELGAGGMGVVVEAEHVELGRLVALKTLRPELVDQPGFVERFLREARIVAGLRSPHVARVLDVDRLDDGAPVLVLERLFGVDLGALVARDGPLPVEVAARLVIEACDVLAEAHDRGVVHRDLKPSNLFLAGDSPKTASLKVLDFGVAKLVDDGARTSTGHALGSPRYMAPEQVRRQVEVDRRADVWALGVTLARLVGDRAPFDGEDALAVAASVLELPPDLSGVPSVELAAIVARCLETEPSARFPDAVELARALAPLGGDHGARALSDLLRRRDARAAEPAPHEAGPRGDVTLTFDAPLPAAPLRPGDETTAPVDARVQEEDPARTPPRVRWSSVAAPVAALAAALALLALTRGDAHRPPASVEASSSIVRGSPMEPPAIPRSDDHPSTSPSPSASTATPTPSTRAPATRHAARPRARVEPPADVPAATALAAPPTASASAPPPPDPPRRDPLGERK